MKKIFLLVLVISISQASLAQKSFLLMPEMEAGCAATNVIDKDYNTSFHFNFGITLGLSDKSENDGNFYGIYLARNGYSYEGKNNSNKDCVIARGSSSFGMQILHKKMDVGLIYGGIIGINIWDDYYMCDDDLEDISSKGNILIKGKFGYSWSHIALILEPGYNNGGELNFCIALPLYWK